MISATKTTMAGMAKRARGASSLVLRAWWMVACGSVIPRQALACPVCFGMSDSPMATGMKLALLALLGITVAVLGAFAIFFMYLMRRSRAMAAGTAGEVDWHPQGGP